MQAGDSAVFSLTFDDDVATLPLLGAGADGVISVASNEVPQLMAQLVETRDVTIHNRLLPLLFANFIESNPGPVKAALVKMGIIESDTVRPPLAPMREENRKKLEQILKEVGVL